MKLQALYDLQQELNRLFIAGSKFAKEDPRLKKYIPVLNKLGEKAPVFKMVATQIEELIVTNTQQSSEKLMNLSVLLYSILYTQGETVEAEGTESPQVPDIPLDEVHTTHSYLELKPALDALTTSNSGRVEILKEAYDRHIFNDSRTYAYLDKALNDKYSELADYIEETIIPSIGKPIIPFLLKGFKYEDRKENVRRLRLLHKMGNSRVPEMVETILSESLPALRVECVHILSEKADQEELILSLADDKNKQVREAAYMALAKMNTKTTLERLTSAFLKSKKDIEGIVCALATTKLPYFFQDVYDQVVRSFEEFITLDKGEMDKVLENKLSKLAVSIEALTNKDKPEMPGLFTRILKDTAYNKLVRAKRVLLQHKAEQVTANIINCLSSMEPGKKLTFFENEIHEIPEVNWNRPLWNNYFYTAIEGNYPKDKIYDLFSPLFIKEQVITVWDLNNVYTSGRRTYYSYDQIDDFELLTDKIDPRWIALCYKKLEGEENVRFSYEPMLNMIDAYEGSKSEKFDKLLVKLTRKEVSKDDYQGLVFSLLVKRKVTGCFELIYNAMSKKKHSYLLSGLSNLSIWKEFPEKYAAKFRELHKKNQLSGFGYIADEIEGQ